MKMPLTRLIIARFMAYFAARFTTHFTEFAQSANTRDTVSQPNADKLMRPAAADHQNSIQSTRT
ncbi:hypothetical protein P5W99_21255 [Paraburkholderia sp. A3BS-1L]|uniref:hypothetical protein n=1 Tax=Paraburkholderia sp. A3BS-1L TaxID=3028375 RepID=UPI003DA86971